MSALATVAEDPRQCWRTPRRLFDALHSRFRFDVDAAADHVNHLLPRYWTRLDDGVAQLVDEKNKDLRAFVNPPYDDIAPWVEACFDRSNAFGAASVLLLPSRTDQKWFHDYARFGAIYYSRGRVQFEPPPGIRASSNNCGSILVVFDHAHLIGGVFDAKTGEGLR